MTGINEATLQDGSQTLLPLCIPSTQLQKLCLCKKGGAMPELPKNINWRVQKSRKRKSGSKRDVRGKVNLSR